MDNRILLFALGTYALIQLFHQGRVIVRLNRVIKLMEKKK